MGPAGSSPQPHTKLSKNNLSTHLRALFTSDFLIKILYARLRSYTRTTRPIHLILRDLITLT
jgi:hypothetical protein